MNAVFADGSLLPQLIISNVHATAGGWSARITVPVGGDYSVVIATVDANGNDVTFGSLGVEPDSGGTYQVSGTWGTVDGGTAVSATAGIMPKCGRGMAGDYATVSVPSFYLEPS